jgi:hypothetical protein
MIFSPLVCRELSSKEAGRKAFCSMQMTSGFLVFCSTLIALVHHAAAGVSCFNGMMSAHGVFKCPSTHCANGEAYCTGDGDCVAADFEAGGVCCEAVAGNDDCCLTCDSSDLGGCPLMAYGASWKCFMDDNEVIMPWRLGGLARCKNAKSRDCSTGECVSTSDCYGANGKCCHHGSKSSTVSPVNDSDSNGSTAEDTISHAAGLCAGALTGVIAATALASFVQNIAC